MRVKNAKGREGRVAWKTLADGGGPHPARLRRGDDDPHRAGLHRHRAYLCPAVRLAGGDRLCRLLSGTRHRRASYLVISEGAEKAEVARARPLNDIRPIRAEDAWANVAANFARQPVKELAIDFWPRPGQYGEARARSLQDGMRRVQGARRDPSAPDLSYTRETDALTPVARRSKGPCRGSVRSSSGSRSWVRPWRRPCGTGSNTCADRADRGQGPAHRPLRPSAEHAIDNGPTDRPAIAQSIDGPSFFSWCGLDALSRH